MEQRRILCSFFESWGIIRPKKAQYRFNKAGMTFFLAFEKDQDLLKKQIFRLDWDNWQNDDPPNKAAYPHWQFDRWLTASEPRDASNALRERFVQVGEEVLTFEAAMRGQALEEEAGRPHLRWFTRLHFPAIAPWTTFPIKSLEDASKPRVIVRCPSRWEQLGDWMESTLRYLKNELQTYASS